MTTSAKQPTNEGTGLICTWANGTPWTVVRTVNGKQVLMAAIRVDGKWVETPADKVIAMVNKTKPKAVSKPRSDRQGTAAKHLHELTMRMARGELH